MHSLQPSGQPVQLIAVMQSNWRLPGMIGDSALSTFRAGKSHGNTNADKTICTNELRVYHSDTVGLYLTAFATLYLYASSAERNRILS